jgi:hypothetical protein
MVGLQQHMPASACFLLLARLPAHPACTLPACPMLQQFTNWLLSHMPCTHELLHAGFVQLDLTQQRNKLAAERAQREYVPW